MTMNLSICDVSCVSAAGVQCATSGLTQAAQDIYWYGINYNLAPLGARAASARGAAPRAPRAAPPTRHTRHQSAHRVHNRAQETLAPRPAPARSTAQPGQRAAPRGARARGVQQDIGKTTRKSAAREM